MTIMWIIIGLVIVAGGGISMLSKAWRSNHGDDMGTVSGQWLAEHRQSQES